MNAYTLYPEMVETEFSSPYQRNNPCEHSRTHIPLVRFAPLLAAAAPPHLARGRPLICLACSPVSSARLSISALMPAASADIVMPRADAVLRTPDEVAERMLELVGGYGAEDSGRFINIWSGDDIAW